jgi:hypothetical protein
MATEALASDDGTAWCLPVLETTASFTEDLLNQLNQITVNQQQQFDDLTRGAANCDSGCTKAM